MRATVSRNQKRWMGRPAYSRSRPCATACRVGQGACPLWLLRSSVLCASVSLQELVSSSALLADRKLAKVKALRAPAGAAVRPIDQITTAISHGNAASKFRQLL